jgi:hypothetical protein
MKTLANWSVLLAIVAAGLLAGCFQNGKSPEVTGNFRTVLDQAGLKKAKNGSARPPEPISCDTECRVVMEPAPITTFKVSQAPTLVSTPRNPVR